MDSINPGIRRVVEFLNNAGFETCDSGDGKTHDHACDRPHPYVVVTCHPALLVATADALLRHLREAGVAVDACDEVGECVSIQASYDPGNRLAFVDLSNLDDARLGAAIAGTTEFKHLTSVEALEAWLKS